MGLFDIWKPKPDPEKEEKGRLKPHSPALPYKSEQVHALPGPAPAQAPKPIAKVDPFARFAPKEPPKAEQARPTERPRSLIDAMVPEGERGSMYRRSPEQEIFERQAAPPPPRVQESFRPQAAPVRRTRGWTLPTPEDFSERLPDLFNLDGIFKKVRKDGSEWDRTRHAPGVGFTTSVASIGSLSDIDTLAQFFGVPRDVVDSYLEGVPPDQEVAAMGALWDDIFWPLVEMTTVAFQLVKPDDLDGLFILGSESLGPLEVVILLYTEEIF